MNRVSRYVWTYRPSFIGARFKMVFSGVKCLNCRLAKYNDSRLLSVCFDVPIKAGILHLKKLKLRIAIPPARGSWRKVPGLDDQLRNDKSNGRLARQPESSCKFPSTDLSNQTWAPIVPVGKIKTCGQPWTHVAMGPNLPFPTSVNSDNSKWNKLLELLRPRIERVLMWKVYTAAAIVGCLPYYCLIVLWQILRQLCKKKQICSVRPPFPKSLFLMQICFQAVLLSRFLSWPLKILLTRSSIDMAPVYGRE